VQEAEADAGGAALSTSQVVDLVVKPRTQSADMCHYLALPEAAGHLWSPGSGHDLWFISHAFGNPFRLVLDTLCAHFRDAPADTVCGTHRMPPLHTHTPARLTARPSKSMHGRCGFHLCHRAETRWPPVLLLLNDAHNSGVYMVGYLGHQSVEPRQRPARGSNARPDDRCGNRDPCCAGQAGAAAEEVVVRVVFLRRAYMLPPHCF
jgi:hypothetical protein